MWDAASAVFGSESEAEEWLIFPSPELSPLGCSPIELLAGDVDGMEAKRLIRALKSHP